MRSGNLKDMHMLSTTRNLAINHLTELLKYWTMRSKSKNSHGSYV